MLFSYKFLTFSQFRNKFYIRKSTTTHIPTPTENPPLSTQNPPPHNTKPPKHHPHHHNNNKKIRDQREKDWEIEGKRDWLGKRDRCSVVAMIFNGGDEISLGWVENEISLEWWRQERDARLRSRWWRHWSMACGRLSRSELNLYSSVHGWRSERWVLGVCGLVMREGWAEIFNCVMSMRSGLVISDGQIGNVE